MFKNKATFFFFILFMINSYFQISIYVDKSNKLKKKFNHWNFRVKTLKIRPRRFLSKKKIKKFRMIRNRKNKEKKIRKEKLKKRKNKIKEFKEFLQKNNS